MNWCIRTCEWLTKVYVVERLPSQSQQSRGASNCQCNNTDRSASRRVVLVARKMHGLVQVTFLILYLAQGCLGLLEEDIVSFDPEAATSRAVNIVDCPIICSQDDYIGVHIAVRSLATDLEQITGNPRRVLNLTAPYSTTALAVDNAIIVASLNSSLIRRLVTNHVFNPFEIQGKWESFKTTVVENPLPGVLKALVIAGSDKRGAIYGAHTLAEQSGQSPCVQ